MGILRDLQEAQRRIDSARAAIEHLAGYTPSSATSVEQSGTKTAIFVSNEIYETLLKLSEPLACSYAQVKTDIQDTSRSSWAGTAHEIREILAQTLRIMAPDEKVKAQKWYKQETNASGPTRRQRARYILESQGAGSREQETVENILALEDAISKLIDGMYGRASDAAHRFKDRKEVLRVLDHIEIGLKQLLNLD